MSKPVLCYLFVAAIARNGLLLRDNKKKQNAPKFMNTQVKNKNTIFTEDIIISRNNRKQSCTLIHDRV